MTTKVTQNDDITTIISDIDLYSRKVAEGRIENSKDIKRRIDEALVTELMFAVNNLPSLSLYEEPVTVHVHIHHKTTKDNDNVHTKYLLDCITKIFLKTDDSCEYVDTHYTGDRTGDGFIAVIVPRKKFPQYLKKFLKTCNF